MWYPVSVLTIIESRCQNTNIKSNHWKKQQKYVAHHGMVYIFLRHFLEKKTASDSNGRKISQKPDEKISFSKCSPLNPPEGDFRILTALQSFLSLPSGGWGVEFHAGKNRNICLFHQTFMVPPAGPGMKNGHARICVLAVLLLTAQASPPRAFERRVWSSDFSVSSDHDTPHRRRSF